MSTLIDLQKDVTYQPASFWSVIQDVTFCAVNTYTVHFTNKTDATAGFTWTGSRLLIRGVRKNQQGTLNITLDSVTSTVDLYARQPLCDILLDSSVGYGTHTVNLSLSFPATSEDVITSSSGVS
ncbi:hypothetical protein K474DRAFT_1706454 [Panus rudis PR-1116 ss-1]|nr:hypothetical protein K474DRAFT_1706454 [Panus rudis PR-1116 ss-1]